MKIGTKGIRLEIIPVLAAVGEELANKETKR